jgi:hypothetical protein
MKIDLSRLLKRILTEEAHVSDSSDNSLEDELEISPIGNNQNSNSTQYKVGQIMNVTIDSDDSLVNVNLDQNTLKEIFSGSGS